MSNVATGTQRRQQHQQRLAWLATHPALLARLPGAADDVEPTQSAALDEALRGMKLIRLFAPTSTPTSCRWGIRLCVSELRGQHVAKGHGHQ